MLYINSGHAAGGSRIRTWGKPVGQDKERDCARQGTQAVVLYPIRVQYLLSIGLETTKRGRSLR